MPATAIKEEVARSIAAEKYNQLFHEHVVHQLNGTELRYPALQPKDFGAVESDRDVWVVRCDRLVGWNVTARVAKNGDWAAIQNVAFARH